LLTVSAVTVFARILPGAGLQDLPENGVLDVARIDAGAFDGGRQRDGA
jgi:hypothetical protein